uniref:Putative secreted protein n=1 Tax=Anopheles triannulatus TaxID=58253 RepID=A0A2M4B1Z3_9DIPT
MSTHLTMFLLLQARLGEGFHHTALGQDDHHRDADVHHGCGRLGDHPAERGFVCACACGRLCDHHRVYIV